MTPTASPCKFTKASIRRLAHDVDQRLSKHSYEVVNKEVEEFLERILSVGAQASEYARKKAISKDHIYYATTVLNVDVPKELTSVKLEDLERLQRCNIRAPAQQRKKSALHAEVSEAAFARVVKKVIQKNKSPRRLSVAARHFLHLITEQQIMRTLSNPGKECTPSTTFRDTTTRNTISRVLNCSDEQAEAVAGLITNTMNNIPALLDISKSQTVDARVVKLAVATHIQICPTVEVPRPVSIMCSRIIRGRITDRRVTGEAANVLGQAVVTYYIASAGKEPTSL